jgi:mono/diheme cytochrome c family protein
MGCRDWDVRIACSYTDEATLSRLTGAVMPSSIRPGRHLLLAAFAMVVIVLAAVQLVPYGRAHTNPPARGAPVWDSPTTRELFTRACADCHSHQTVWPWYSNLAPMSWLVQRDVDQGRAEFNVSAAPDGSGEAHEAAGTVRDGEMPPAAYLLLHPEARLTEAERRALIQGLAATFRDEREGERRGSRRRYPECVGTRGSQTRTRRGQRRYCRGRWKRRQAGRRALSCRRSVHGRKHADGEVAWCTYGVR